MTLTQRLQLFFPLLALVTLAATIGLILMRPSRRSWLADLGRHRYPMAAAVAITCMSGSLYFSEVANYLPCTLCWYQRIPMYSLAVILVVASWRGDEIRAAATVLATIGALIAIYHWLLERIPDLDAGVCSVTISCEFVWFEKFGFVTLPFMAAVGFVSIITLLNLPADETPGGFR